MPLCFSATATAQRATDLCWENASDNPVERLPSYASNLHTALIVALARMTEEEQSHFLSALAYELQVGAQVAA